MSIFSTKKKKKKDIEIGDFVKETASSKGKKKCGEVLMILADNPGDPTIECVEVHPDELTPLEKGSDGMRTFRTKRSKLKPYTLENSFSPRKLLKRVM